MLDKETLEILNKLVAGQERLEAGQMKLEAGQKKLEAGQESIKIQVTENTQILRALEHNEEINKSEHDKMQNDISHIEGDLTHVKNEIGAIRKDLTQVEIVTSSSWNEIAKLKSVK